MLTSLAFIFLVGLAISSICQKIKLPGIVGFIITGVVLGPYVLDLLEPSILNISAELRQMALIIILVKAGLSLNLDDLKKVGRPALLMSMLPAIMEIIGFVIFGPIVLEINYLEAAIIGAILAAVSPAVVVNRMVDLIDKKIGTNKSIPQLIIAGSSLDDIFVIVLFTALLSMAKGGSLNIMQFLDIPISVILGVIVGVIFGFVLSTLFETSYIQKHYIRNSMKMIIIIGCAFLIMSIETWAKSYVEISGFLAVIAMSCVIKMKSVETVTERLSSKFGKFWLSEEVLLFVLVGAAVNIEYTLKAGIGAILVIFIALVFRSIGVWLSLINTGLNNKEKLFCIISYLPKATVQAAIGSIPLSMGLPCGDIALSIAILSILITAPLGAFLIDYSHKYLLDKQA